ncbi:MAG TPA: hypothetical protein VKX46_16625 [Ktedonobacteraceae bacterium]|nr:hypothetical protein [Ktedonobacteraceae bacterium]
MPDHIPTLADVCSAIAEGRLVVNSDGSEYHVNALELRRYFTARRLYSAPSIASLLSSIRADREWARPNQLHLG